MQFLLNENEIFKLQNRTKKNQNTFKQNNDSQKLKKIQHRHENVNISRIHEL